MNPNDTSRANLHTEPHRSLRIQQEGGGGTALTFDHKIISMQAHGMTTREILGRIEAISGVETPPA